MTFGTNELSWLLSALLLLLIFAHAFGYALTYLGLPRICGELLGGVFLGDTVFGRLTPCLKATIFNAFPGQDAMLSLISWLGLIFLMFLSGMGISLGALRRQLLLIFSLAAIVMPTSAAGGIVAILGYDFTAHIGPAANATALSLVIVIAMGITSIPVISRIFMDIGVIETPFARIVLSIATLQDIVMWCGLAVATSMANNTQITAWGYSREIFVTLAFFILSVIVGARLLSAANNARFNLVQKASPTGYALIVCLFFAALANVSGVNIVSGCFLAGMLTNAVPHKENEKIKTTITNIGTAFFIPIYFALTGYKLDLVGHTNILLTLGFVVFSSTVTVCATIFAARRVKRSWEWAVSLGIALTTRGGPGIVLATISYEAKIVNETLFITLIFNSLLTSMFAGWWFARIKRSRPHIFETA